MSKIYKIHKWLSIVSVLFFLMFCITGLILMFRTELNAWAQGGSHHSSLSMEMSQQEMSIFNYADEGALLVKEKGYFKYFSSYGGYTYFTVSYY